RVVKSTGDGFLVEFPSALSAMQCALAVQQAVNKRNVEVPEGHRLQLRIGLHVGEVVPQDGDILGDGVNIASRIERLAPPGGIALSQQVYDQIQHRVNVELASLGKQQLKNVRIPVEVYQVAGEGPSRRSRPREWTRIAVLPLANISPDPADAYFADGMTEELIYRLSQIGGLRVIAQTSAMPYRGADKRISQIGEELGVGVVLEGSVRKAGNRVRITAQLVDTRTEEHLWSCAYERELEDVFALQRDIAHEVAQALEVKLLAGERRQLAKEATQDVEAYTLYLKGRHFWNQRTQEGLERGIDYFQRSLEADPQFAPAHAGLADSFAVLTALGFMPAEEGYPMAEEAALEALRLDEGLAEAHASLGLIRWQYRRDISQAERSLRYAIQLNPNYATAHHWYALALAVTGRLEEGVAEIRRALELDPLSQAINADAGRILTLARRYDEAREQYRSALELAPGYVKGGLYGGLAMACVLQGAVEDARGALEEAERVTDPADQSSQVWIASLRGLAHLQSGEREEAREILKALSAMPPRHDTAFALALLSFGLGEADQGLSWLEEAWERRDANALWAKVHPALDTVRDDPCYHDLLTRMGLGD
ncbi:MAG: adenylate/guanylate cyclase domain-containing protein, partial [Candidatus Bipolaricaulota bacterium]